MLALKRFLSIFDKGTLKVKPVVKPYVECDMRERRDSQTLLSKPLGDLNGVSSGENIWKIKKTPSLGVVSARSNPISNVGPHPLNLEVVLGVVTSSMLQVPRTAHNKTKNTTNTQTIEPIITSLVPNK